MVTITDQIFLSLCLPLDPRLTNLVITGSNVKVETEGEYLARVDLGSRSLGMEVEFLSPSGTYEVNTFLADIQDGTISTTKYKFLTSTANSGFSEYSGGSGGGHIIRNTSAALPQQPNLQFSDRFQLTDNDLTGSTEIEMVVDNTLNESSTNAVQNGVVTTTLNQILGVIAVHPTYIAPVATLTNFTQTLEYGSSLSLSNQTLTFTQNDAGSATLYSILRNGILYSSASPFNISESNIQSTITYSGSISYEEGITKNNNLGIADPYGKILAGTVNATSRIITPRYKFFYGNYGSVPTTSEQVRTLNSVFETTTTLDLVTGTTNRYFVVCIPSGKSISSVTDLTNLGANITTVYVLVNGSFPLLDAGGNEKIYKLYVMTADIPYSVSATHRIIIV